MNENLSYLIELRGEVEAKAKRANQRLRQLEQSGIAESSRAYQVTARKVYDQLPGYTQTRAGNIAFDRALKDKTIAQLEEELSELDNFLGARTATVRQYKESLKSSYYGYLESQGELDEEDKPVKGATTFRQWQQLFASEVGKHYGYQVVAAIQRTTKAPVENIEKALNKAIAKERKTGRALGQKNLVKMVETESKKGTKKGTRKRRK